MKLRIDTQTAVLSDTEVGTIEVSANDLAMVFFTNGANDLGLLPPAVRWVSADGLGIVLERPPSVVNFLVGEQTHTVPLPWTVWGLRFNRMRQLLHAHLFVRMQPISMMNDPLFFAPYPVTDAEGEAKLKVFSEAGGGGMPAELGTTLLPSIENFWQVPTIIDALASDNMPEEWFELYDKSGGDLHAYLDGLSSISIQDVVNTEFRVSQKFPDVDALFTFLNTDAETNEDPSPLTYFRGLMEKLL